MRRLIRTGSLSLLLVLGLGDEVSGRLMPQADPADSDRVRFGVTIGGTGFLSLGLEYQFHNRGVELSVGTFSWRDISLSIVGKQYVGGGDGRVFVGAGVWGVAAFPSDARTGYAFVLRAPIGVDWHAVERHSLGFELNLNRAVAMRRTDPEDERPPRPRVVPLPALYYRFGSPR